MLRVARTTLDPDGELAATGVTANGTLPGPEIRARRGDRLRVVVENRLEDDATAIHWRGLLVPAAMDGVPGISTAPIAAGRVAVYEYPLLQSGTYWYHSHWGFQEQVGLFGPLIIEDGEDSAGTDRDVAVMLSDWTHADPAQIFAKLSAPARVATPAGGAPPMQGMEAKGGDIGKERCSRRYGSGCRWWAGSSCRASSSRRSQ